MIKLPNLKKTFALASAALIVASLITLSVFVMKSTHTFKSVTKIVVKLPERSPIPDDSTLKVITNQDDIAKIIRFTNSQLLKPDWQAENSVDGFIQLFFYEGENRASNFNLGGVFFSTNNPKHRERQISEDERIEFLRLIGVTQIEYSDLWSKQFRSGPWKQL